jgi:hypothetical protein
LKFPLKAEGSEKSEILNSKSEIHPPAAGKNPNGRNFNDQNKSPKADFAADVGI